MKKLAVIEAFGFEAVPWSVPDIGNVTTKGGKRVRFARRKKKNDPDRGRLNLDAWQAFVRGAAEKAMATISVPTGPIRLYIEFFARTPPGRRHGELWDVPLRWDEAKGDFIKSQPRGKQEPDLVNLFKGTEDAVAGVTFVNDCQTRMLSTIALFGPQAGVRATVYAIEPNDYPGHGVPVE
jgi:hypothetical protein